MNFRLTAVLFAAVLVLVVGLLIYALTAPDPSLATAGPFAALTGEGVKAEDVTVIEIARTQPKDEKLVFEKAGGRWRLTAPAPGGADTATLDALVRDLLALKPVGYDQPIERATAGFGRDEVSITLKAGDRSAAVLVGDTTPGTDQAVTFLAPAADPAARPVAVPARGLRASLFRPASTHGKASVLVKGRSEFRPRQLLDVDGRTPETDVTAVSVARGEKRLALARTGTDWRFTQPAEYGPADFLGASDADPLRFTGVRPLLNALLLLGTTSPADVTEDVPAADLPKYGLADGPEAVRVELTPKDGKPITLFLGKRIDDADGKPAVPTRHFARVAGDAAVFRVSTNDVDKLLNTLNDPTPLRNRDLLPPASLAQIDAVDSTAGGGYRLRRVAGTEPKWVLYGGGEPAEAQAQVVQSTLARLAAPRVAADVLLQPDDAAFDEKNLQAELKVWVNGVDEEKAKGSDGKLPAEPPVSGEPITLRFGKAFVRQVPRPDGVVEDRPLVMVRRVQGKEVADFEVPREVAALALQPRLKLVDAPPPSFRPTQATRLVLFRNDARSEFVKNATAADPAYRQGGWELVDKDQRTTADGDAVYDLLTRLAALPPTLAMEKADDLKAIGLDPTSPRLRATVTVPDEKGGTAEVEFHFGDPVKGDDKAVYYKAVGKPFVYSVPAETVARLRTADLTDKVVFRVDPKRVRKLIFRGWRQGADRTPTDVIAELQNGAWVATAAPKGATLDAGRVRDWVDALRAVKRFGVATVEPGKPPPDEYGFGTDPLTVTVDLAGEKPGDPPSALAVTFGGLTADQNGVYAQVSGRYELLDARPFLMLLPRPPLAGR